MLLCWKLISFPVFPLSYLSRTRNGPYIRVILKYICTCTFNWYIPSIDLDYNQDMHSYETSYWLIFFFVQQLSTTKNFTCFACYSNFLLELVALDTHNQLYANLIDIFWFYVVFLWPCRIRRALSITLVCLSHWHILHFIFSALYAHRAIDDFWAVLRPSKYFSSLNEYFCFFF